MTFGGYGPGGDPFGGDDPFGGADPYGAPAPYSAPTQGFAPPPPAPSGETNTLATLSVVFAFVFAPAGAVLGHVALSQIKRRNQPGRGRAILGITLSYALIVLAVVALVVWLLLRKDDGAAPVPATTTTVKAITITRPPVTRSTVITPPTSTRATVRVEELQVGDCVEIQQTRPDPNEAGTDNVMIYRAACEVRDGVFQVYQIVGSRNQCTGYMLFNAERTIFACYSKYGE